MFIPLFILVLSPLILAKTCPKNSIFGLSGEFKCNLELEKGSITSPKCWCKKDSGFTRHPNGSCVAWEDCPETQHECATFEIKVLSGPRERTCLSKDFRKPTITTTSPRCQCKKGTVRQLGTGKCVNPRNCPRRDVREYSSKYEEFDENCLGRKIYYDYGARNKGFCKKGTFRLSNGECVKREQCPK